jgi:site-specific DNA recombinase
MNNMAIATVSKKYAMYLRISREHGENEDTLRNHRELLTEFAKRENMEFDLYEEIVSGMKQDISEREEFHKIFQNAERYAGIIVLKLDRLARHETVAMQFRDLCIDHELPIITPTRTYNLRDNNDVMMYGMEAMFSANEGRSIAYRNKMNKIIRARRGEWITSQAAYGYRKNKETKRLEKYEPEAEVVRYIFRLHSQGLGSYSIRDILNDEGYKPQRSDHWNLPSIKRIIRNEVYKGTVVFKDRKKVMRNGKSVYETVEEIRCENAHPAIIPPKEWDEANKEREARAKKSAIVRDKPAVKTGVTSLKDLIYCGCCGRKMTIRKDNKSAIGYTIKRCEYLSDDGSKCRNSGIKLIFVEDDVLAKVMKRKEELEAYLKTLEDNDSTEYMDELQQRLNQLDKRIKEVKAQDDKLLDLALSGNFSNEQISEKKLELTNTLRHLNEQREAVLVELEAPKVEDKKEKIQGIIDVIDSLPTLDTKSLNEALKSFIKQIRYTRAIPEDILKLSTRNPARKLYPFEIEIEYR